MAGHRANDLDVRIGARIAKARRAAGVSQQELGDALDVSMAQVAEYEAGINRIAASKLARVAELVGRPIAAFFDAPSVSIVSEGPVGGHAEPCEPRQGRIETM